MTNFPTDNERNNSAANRRQQPLKSSRQDELPDGQPPSECRRETVQRRSTVSCGRGTVLQANTGSGYTAAT